MSFPEGKTMRQSLSSWFARSLKAPHFAGFEVLIPQVFLKGFSPLNKKTSNQRRSKAIGSLNHLKSSRRKPKKKQQLVGGLKPNIFHQLGPSLLILHRTPQRKTPRNAPRAGCLTGFLGLARSHKSPATATSYLVESKKASVPSEGLATRRASWYGSAKIRTTGHHLKKPCGF